MLRQLLQQFQNASIPEQGCAGLSSGSANRKHQITRHPWRTSPQIRPSLSFRTSGHDHEVGHYDIIDEGTIKAELYSFLDTCDKKVLRNKKSEVIPFAPNKLSVSETGEALKALGHVLPTVEQPHWLDGRDGPNPADLICFPNGILNIDTNEFTPPDPMLFTPHGVGFDYDPNAPT